MDRKIKDARTISRREYRMGTAEIKMLCYADDAVLLSESENNLQRILHRFYRTVEEYNMKINVENTKCITLSKEPLTCKLTVNDKPIEQVMQFRYLLGIDFSSYGNLYKEMF